MGTFDTSTSKSALRRWGSLVAAGLLSFTLYGCGSSDPVAPPPPPPPPPPPISAAQVIAAEAAKAANDSATNPTAPFAVMSTAGLVPVTINSKPVVNFSVFDNGAVKTGLTTSNVTFMISKLVPGANGASDKWVNYIWVDDAGGWGMAGATQDAAGNWTSGTPIVTDQTKARTGSTDAKTASQLVYNADGYYTYTFSNDIVDSARANAKDSSGNAVVYEPGRTHRLSLQLSYTNSNAETVRVNPYYDFTIGADGKSVAVAPSMSREVVAVASCNNCHEKLAFHGGGRVDTTLCIQCHQPGSIDKGTGQSIDLMNMLHRIHIGKDLPSVAQGVGQARNVVFRFFGGSERIYDYSWVGFPMMSGYTSPGILGCAKCHDGTPQTSRPGTSTVQTVQGNNWFEKPNRATCGSCHDTVNFATGGGTSISGAAGGHAGLNLVQADDTKCALCHTGTDIKLYHRSTAKTPHNPDVPVGQPTFTYEINSATVNASNETVIKFRVKKDGVNEDVRSVPTGVSGGPSFLFAWTMAQDGVTTPADFNNLMVADVGPFAGTNSRADGLSAGLSTLGMGTAGTGTNGTISAPDADGWQTATVTGASVKFPSGAKMRTVAMQGYWTLSGLRLATPSPVKTVTGDTARRSVVDNAKCANCHENLMLHGGNRVYDTALCVMCHNPNKATSGRGIEDSLVPAGATLKILAQWGITAPFASGWQEQLPVTSNNLKDLVHGIHIMKDRGAPFRDARRFSATNLSLFDFSRIAFPGNISNCQTCHKPGTYASVPATGLASTQELRNAAYATDPLVARATMQASWNQPNANDFVATPFAAACASCHDSAIAKSHIGLNGGWIGATGQLRSGLPAAGPASGETCALCHGAGKVADVNVVHAQ